jgi:hypothetical protein
MSNVEKSLCRLTDLSRDLRHMKNNAAAVASDLEYFLSTHCGIDVAASVPVASMEADGRADVELAYGRHGDRFRLLVVTRGAGQRKRDAEIRPAGDAGGDLQQPDTVLWVDCPPR